MVDIDVFIHMAEIAGVFVGFAALIAVRSGGDIDVFEIGYMRMVIALGMATVIAALAPVVLNRYGVEGHMLWASSSLLAVATWIVLIAANARTPEYRENWSRELAETSRGWTTVVYWAAYLVYIAASLTTPAIVILGLLPDLEEALYLTTVVLILFGASWCLLELVYAQRPEPTARA